MTFILNLTKINENASGENMQDKVRQGFINSVPVLAGYVVLGAAFGAYVYGNDLPFWSAVAMSVFIYAGSMQFAAVPILLMPFNFIQTFLLTLSINARLLFYGISMKKTIDKAGNKKQYMIFALTDESYSVIINQNDTESMFWTMLLNQLYWIFGTIMGYILIQYIPISTQGIEFSMTALFMVIFIEKCLDRKPVPIIIGLVSSILAFLIFGANAFVIPSMILIMGALLIDGGKS